jgi:hypothetical protein
MVCRGFPEIGRVRPFFKSHRPAIDSFPPEVPTLGTDWWPFRDRKVASRDLRHWESHGTREIRQRVPQVAYRFTARSSIMKHFTIDRNYGRHVDSRVEVRKQDHRTTHRLGQRPRRRSERSQPNRGIRLNEKLPSQRITQAGAWGGN